MDRINQIVKSSGQQPSTPLKSTTPQANSQQGINALTLMECQPKIRTYSPNMKAKEWASLGALLFACAKYIGITPPPQPQAIDLILMSLKKNCPDVNAAEINEAFDMYAMQKLKYTDHHHNSFSLYLVGHILSSYKEYRASELMKVKKTNYDESKFRMDRAEMIEYLDRELFKKFDDFKKTEQFNWSLMSANGLYKKLENLGIINMSIDEKNQIAKEVVKRLRQNIASLVKDGSAKKLPNGEFQIEKVFVQSKCREESFWVLLQVIGV
jgi:hypothetical protein